MSPGSIGREHERPACRRHDVGNELEQRPLQRHEAADIVDGGRDPDQRREIARQSGRRHPVAGGASAKTSSRRITLVDTGLADRSATFANTA